MFPFCNKTTHFPNLYILLKISKYMNTIDYYSLLWKPYNSDIFELCDGTHSVKDIQERTQLTYKSVLKRLKELEKAKIIKIENAVAVGKKNKIFINKNYEKDVEKVLFFSNHGREYLKNSLKNKEGVKFLMDILKLLTERRLIERHEFLQYFKNRPAKLVILMDSLSHTGMIRERYDITKKGKNFLRKCEKHENLKK